MSHPYLFIGRKDRLKVISMNFETKPVRILLEQSGYGLTNLGDLAMLQVAVERIRLNFPKAKLFIFTSSAEKLEKYFPGTTPVLPQARNAWQEAKIIPIPRRFLLDSWVKRLSYLEGFIKFRFPRIANYLRRVTNLRAPYGKDEYDYFSVIQEADMVLVSGGGFITDHFKNHAKAILDTLSLAQKLGKPTAMFGQGIGPLSNKPVMKLARQVLSKLKVLGIRDGVTSKEYGNILRGPHGQVLITGDDSIEIALKHREKSVERNNIGVNIRLAYYSGNFQHLLPEVGNLLKDISRSSNSPIIPIPVQISNINSDLSSILQLCDLEEREFELAQSIISPEDLIKQICRCKIVITGSYHAGVFALACGIPIVAMAGSDYYEAKFAGLAHQFGIGVNIVHLNSENMLGELKGYIENALKHPNEMETKLIEKARQQVELSRNAWNTFLETKSFLPKR
jgi:polysaccharide pyruvyl transferase WcaK-like protein